MGLILYKIFKGSVPGKINSNGKCLTESANEVVKLNVGGVTNVYPK